MALDDRQRRREGEGEDMIFSSPTLDPHFLDGGLPGFGAQVENLIPSCCSPCRQIAALTAQIAQAEATTIAAQTTQFEADIAALKRQVCAVQTERNSIHDPLSLRFPPEVISRIFYYSCGSPPSFGPPATSTQDRTAQHNSLTRPQPLVLGAVCKNWRRVAWSSPMLWTDVSIRFRSASRVDTELELMDEWLSLSGRLPITLGIIADLGVFGDSTSTPLVLKRQQAIGVITGKYSDRLCSLDIKIPDVVFWLVISQLELGSSLDELSIHADTPPPSYIRHRSGLPMLFRRTIAANFGAPAPRTIRTKAIPPEYLNVSWKNATHIELVYVEDHSCIAVLKHATNVVSCKLLGLHYDLMWPPSSPDSIALHHLRNLEYNSSQLTSLFSSKVLSFPALDDLTFIVWAELPVTDLLSLVERSGQPPLRSLTLLGSSYTCGEGLLCLLDALPSLEELKLCTPHGSCQFGELLLWQFAGEGEPEPESIRPWWMRPSPRRKHFLPNLRMLEYKGPLRFPWTALRFLLPRRSEPDLPDPEASSTSMSRTPPSAKGPPLVSSSLEGSHMQRPLRTVRFGLLVRPDESCIDKDVVLAILDGQQRFGIQFDVVGLSESACAKDLLKASMAHHGIPFPEDDGVGVHLYQEM